MLSPFLFHKFPGFNYRLHRYIPFSIDQKINITDMQYIDSSKRIVYERLNKKQQRCQNKIPRANVYFRKSVNLLMLYPMWAIISKRWDLLMIFYKLFKQNYTGFICWQRFLRDIRMKNTLGPTNKRSVCMCMCTCCLHSQSRLFRCHTYKEWETSQKINRICKYMCEALHPQSWCWHMTLNGISP